MFKRLTIGIALGSLLLAPLAFIIATPAAAKKGDIVGNEYLGFCLDKKHQTSCSFPKGKTFSYGGLTLSEDFFKPLSFMLFKDKSGNQWIHMQYKEEVRTNDESRRSSLQIGFSDPRLANLHPKSGVLTSEGSGKRYQIFSSKAENSLLFVVQLSGEVTLKAVTDGKSVESSGGIDRFEAVFIDSQIKSGGKPVEPPSGVSIPVTVKLNKSSGGTKEPNGGWERADGIRYTVKLYATKQNSPAVDPGFAGTGKENTLKPPGPEDKTTIDKVDTSNGKSLPYEPIYYVVAFFVVQQDGSISADTDLDEANWWNPGEWGDGVVKDAIVGISGELYMGTCKVPYDGSGEKLTKDGGCTITMKFQEKISEGGVLEQAFGAVFGKMADITSGMIRMVQGFVSENGILNSRSIADNQGIRDAWTLTRNIANIFFLIILLVIAFTNVSRIGIEYYTMRSLLPKFVAAAVLVNLSFLLCMIIIDAADVFTVAFQNLKIGDSTNDYSHLFGSFSDLAGGVASAVAGIIIIVLALIAAIVLWALLLIRLLMIWILVIFSPLAFMANVLPATSSLSKSWWNQFIRFVMMAPIVAFVLKIGDVLANSAGLVEGATSDPSDAKLYLQPALAAFTLILAAMIPIFMGGKIMAAASGYIRGAMGRVGAGVARGTGLAAARERLADRRGAKQELRGAKITDAMGFATRGRVGTRGAAEQVRMARGGKIAKDYDNMTDHQLDQIATRSNDKVERAEAMKARISRMGAQESIDYLTAHDSLRNRVGGRGVGDDALQGAFANAVENHPEILRDQRMQALRQRLSSRTGLLTSRLARPIAGARGNRGGRLSHPRYVNEGAYAMRVAGEKLNGIGASAFLADQGVDADGHPVGGISASEKRLLPVTPDSIHTLQRNRLNNILSADNRERLGLYARRLRAAGATDEQVLERVRSRAARYTQASVGATGPGSNQSFHEWTPEHQRMIASETVLHQPYVAWTPPAQGGSSPVSGPASLRIVPRTTLPASSVPSVPSGMPDYSGPVNADATVPQPAPPPAPSAPAPTRPPVSSQPLRPQVASDRAEARSNPGSIEPPRGRDRRSAVSPPPPTPAPQAPITATTGESTPAAPAPAASAQASDTAQAANAPGFSTPAAPPAPAPTAPATTTLSPESREAASRIAGTARSGGQRFVDARPQMEAALSGRPDWEQLSPTGRLRELQRIWRGGK